MFKPATWRKRLFVALLVLLSLLALTGSLQSGNYLAVTVNGGGNASGSVTISAGASTVSVTSRTIAASTCTTSCANITGSPRPAVTAANNEEWWSAVFADTGGLSDFDGVIVYIYKTGATIGAFNATKSYGFRWVRKGYNVVTAGDTCPTGTGTPAGCFQELTATGWKNTLTYLIPGDTYRPTWGTGQSASGTWTFAATLSPMAVYTDTSAPNHWNYEADATSKSGGTCIAACKRTGTLDMNMYLSLTLPSANINNATAITPGSTNQMMGTTTWTYTSNAPTNDQMMAGQNLTNQYGDQIPITDVTIGSVSPASSCTGSTCITLSLSNQNYQTNLPVQDGPTNTIYWYLSAPSVVVPGTYTFTYTNTIAWNNQYAN